MSVAAHRPEPFAHDGGGDAAENWDDDFLFQAEDSPAKPPQPTNPTNKRRSVHSTTDTLAWDEELEREEAERQSSVGSSVGPAAGASLRPDLAKWAETDEDDDYGLASRRGSAIEDTVSPLPVFPHSNTGPSCLPSPSKRTRTMTSPSPSTSTSAQSSPVLPNRQIPSSPALSLFSTSTAQQYTPSLASSTAHLQSTRSHDASSPVGAFIPAQPRVPRRRLRKKSRPARPGDIAEDEPVGYTMREPSPTGLGLAITTEEEASWSESSNQPERTPSPVPGPSSPPSKTPLMSRIGSLKNKLGRKPKQNGTSPTHVPSTPARPPRSSTNPTTPRARAPSWFRPPQQTSSSPEETTSPQLNRRKSKEPFWKNVGSFSSGRSPVAQTSESGEDPDHESTVKKPPRKSTPGSRPPLPNSDAFPLPILPTDAGSPTPAGSKLDRARRPMSMGGPAKPSVPVGRTAASLGRGAGMGWASALNDDGENSIMRSLRKFSSSHNRKKSGGEDSPIGIGRAPSSSVGSSRVPSSSTGTSSRRPSLSMSAGVSRTASMTVQGGPRAVPMLKSASAIVLSTGGREYNPSGSVFTLPIGMDREEPTVDEEPRPSLTVQVESPTKLRSSESTMERPSMSELRLPPTPHSRPSSPLVQTSRPSTPQGRPPGVQSTPHGVRVMTPHAARPSSPLATRAPTTPGPPPPIINGQIVDDDYDDDDDGDEALDVIPEGEISRYEALDAASQQAWLDAVAALPTPAPDFSPQRTFTEVEGRPSLSSGRKSSSTEGRKSSSTESYRHSNSIGRSKLHHRKSYSAHAHSKSASEPSRSGGDLLPPIELQPPSPPQTLSGKTSAEHASLLSLASSSRLNSRLGSGSPIGHSSSLGRAATQPGGALDGSVLRRNSLSDLKIPARISRAQSGLKSNLGMVREFAASIEQIRGLQSLYRNLLADLRYAIENNEPLSPVLFPPASRSSATSMTLVRVPSRDIGRVTDRLNGIDERYSLWWECADVLVELGGGNATKDEPTVESKGRERAITLVGNQSAPSPIEPPARKEKDWDKMGELSPRQLHILREMLATPNPSLLHVPGPTTYLNPMHPGATASAITLPSSSGSSHAHGPAKAKVQPGGKIRRASRAGITGIRDLLKYLSVKKPSSSEGSRPSTRLGGESRVSLANASRANLGVASQSQVNLAGQSQANLGSQAHLPRSHSSRSQTVIPTTKSPRRPSLASIFRLNGRSKSKGRVASQEQPSDPDVDDESDWDRMDSASDLDSRVQEKDATLRGRKSGSGRTSNSGRPPVPALPAEFSQSKASLAPATPETGTVPELPSAAVLNGAVLKKGSNRYKQRPPVALAGAVISEVEPSPKSAPLTPGGFPVPTVPTEGRLALTPENLKPLLEYAREVTTRLGACVAELRELGQVDADKLGP